MENIIKYKSRFFSLLESTIGDVKPLLDEQSTNLEIGSGGVIKKKFNPDEFRKELEKKGMRFVDIDVKRSEVNPIYGSMPKGLSKQEIEKAIKYENKLKNGFSLNLDFDVIVSLVAAALEGFPGLGQFGSAIINIVHAISYFIRGLLSSDEVSEMNNYFQGLVQFCMSFVPLAGDFMALGLGQFMKKMIAKTDIELINFLKNTFPFLNIKRGFSLKKKGGMTYLFWAAIKQFGLDRLLDIVTFEKVKKTCIDLNKWLNNKFSNILGISQITNSLNAVIKIIDDLITISKGKPILGLN